MIQTHSVSTNDLEFLWSMLFYASHADEQPGATVESIKRDPDLNRYLSNWGRAGDLGLIATKEAARVGAAWLRHFAEDETNLAAFVAPDVPELAIAVVPDALGEGIGSVMLGRLLDQADDSGIPAIVLSARADNPATRLYERHGFVKTDRIVNRVGTESVKMVRQSRCDLK